MSQVFIISLLLALLNPVSAYAIGGSNLTLSSYPECTCYKPMKPILINSQWELDDYKFQYDQYIDCVNEYIDNANNDIKRIKEKAEEALNEANLSLYYIRI